MLDGGKSSGTTSFGRTCVASIVALMIGLLLCARSLAQLWSGFRVARRAPDAEGGWLTRLTDFGSGRVLDRGSLEGLGVTAMGLTLTEGITADSGSGTPSTGGSGGVISRMRPARVFPEKSSRNQAGCRARIALIEYADK